MFTPGFKLFGGLALFGLVAALVQTFTVTDEFTGIWIYFGLAAAAALVAGIVTYTRDAGVGTIVARTLTPVEAESVGAGAPPVSPSSWPLIGAVGAGLTLVGLVENAFITTVGLAVLAATVVEWMVQGWADRATGDRRYNASVRGRILHPLEFPVLGALVAGLVVYAFSRLMLSLPSKAAVTLFITVGAVILLACAALALRSTISRPVLIGASALGLALAVAAIAVGVSRGARETETELEGVQRAVANKANTFGTVTFTGEGDLPTLTVPKGVDVTLLVDNRTAEKSRLVVMGRRVVADAKGNNTLEVEEFTSGDLGKGKQGSVTFRLPRPSDNKDYRYTYEQQVDGKAVATGLITVPS